MLPAAGLSRALGAWWPSSMLVHIIWVQGYLQNELQEQVRSRATPPCSTSDGLGLQLPLDCGSCNQTLLPSPSVLRAACYCVLCFSVLLK